MHYSGIAGIQSENRWLPPEAKGQRKIASSFNPDQQIATFTKLLVWYERTSKSTLPGDGLPCAGAGRLLDSAGPDRNKTSETDADLKYA